MSKKNCSKVQRGPTEVEWQSLFAATPLAGTEWLPVLKLARFSGLAPTVSRQLPWAQVFPEAAYLVYYTCNSACPARQELPAELARDLALLPREHGHLFPRLQALRSAEFSAEYRRLLRLAQVPAACTLSALVWPYRDKHPHLREQQRLLGALESFVWKHLPAAESARLVQEKLDHPIPGLPLPANFHPAAERKNVV